MTSSRSVGLVILLLSTAWLLSCAGNGSVKGAASAPSSGGSVATSLHVPWVKMNRGERIDYMVKIVLPKMKAEYVAFDAKRFARMDCETCHGPGVSAGTFALPNPDLKPLLEPDLFAKHRQLTPEITKFMLEKVEPDLAALLEIPEFDPATRKGLSCYNCHTREVEPGKPVPPPADHH